MLHLLQLLQLQRPKQGAATAAPTVHTVITAQKKLQHPRILKRPFYKGSRARCSRVQQLQHPKRAKKQARAAPLRAHMKSPKTRERQAFRGLPFRKWDVGNRKCAGFHKKRFKGIRESGTLTRGRHSRRTWASAGATAHLSVPLALHYEALTSSLRSSPLGRLPDVLRVP